MITMPRLRPCWTQPSASNVFLLDHYSPQSFANVVLTVKLAILFGPGNTYDPLCLENGTTHCTTSPGALPLVQVLNESLMQEKPGALLRLQHSRNALDEILDIHGFTVSSSLRV